MQKSYDVEMVNEANRRHFAAAASTYMATEPHYKPENVYAVVKDIHAIYNRQTDIRDKHVLDIGCGTGFMLDILIRCYSPSTTTFHGIDISPEMVEAMPKEISAASTITVGDLYDGGYGNGVFDLVTAYSVLHHLGDVEKALMEVSRVLKPGGYFYSGLDPNGYFLSAMRLYNGIEKSIGAGDYLVPEIHKAVFGHTEMARVLSLEPETISHSEPIKWYENGFVPEVLHVWFMRCGFTDIKITYDWFIAQHLYQNKAYENVLDHYLRATLPASRSLFKYLTVTARKAV